MAKGKKPRPTKSLTKKQVSRRRREQQQLRWIWIAVGIVAVIVVAVIAVGVISHNTRTLAVVNGEAIKVADYEKRVRFYYYSLGPQVFDDPAQGEDPNEVYRQVAELMIEETLIRQEAAKRGITATDEEIQIMVEERWFQHYRNPPPPTATPTVDPQATATPTTTLPSPTATPDTPEIFAAQYRQFVDNVLDPARVRESDFNRIAEVSVLRDKLAEAIIAEIPGEEEQVRFRYTVATDAEQAVAKIEQYLAGTRDEAHARHILVATKEEAEAVLQRLADGEDFAALAAEVSTDPSNKDQGGDLGWFGPGMMVPAFDQVVFESEIGLYPDPVETDFGFHVIEVLARENRPIDMEQELFEAGWYGKSQLASQYGTLFAEMVFGAEIGLFTEPVPTDFGAAIVEVLGHEVRELDEFEKESRREELFIEWLDAVKEEGDIQDRWDPSMIPSRL
jgi:parvulin-like peptidyl-prolyl isomerase